MSEDRIKRLASRQFGLPVDQMRYYNELTEREQAEAQKYWGKIPPYERFVYAAKRAGGLVWRRFSIERLGKPWL
jgi:hypothetical protein